MAVMSEPVEQSAQSIGRTTASGLSMEPTAIECVARIRRNEHVDTISDSSTAQYRR